MVGFLIFIQGWCIKVEGFYNAQFNQVVLIIDFSCDTSNLFHFSAKLKIVI